MGDIFADRPEEIRFQLREGPSHLWLMRNPVLMRGEPGYETDGTHRLKIGDGVTPWNELPYYVDSAAIVSLIQQQVSNTGGVSQADMVAAIQAHIDAVDPHPNYDDGTSFLLRYENAKV